jgi:molybdopterin synthase catalytic subunit
MIELVRNPIDTHSVVERVRSPLAGAVCLFLGTAREVTGEKRTRSLHYDAYDEMASKMLARLESQARERWPIVEVAIVHRLGNLEPAETSVAVAVSTPHRADAFEACRWLMDTLKQEVPIWKRETWADGSEEWIHPGLGET